MESVLTQRKLAEHLKMPRTTVAAALNPKIAPKLRPALRELVQDAARQMGYTPHRAARNLASGKTCTIALATHTSLRYAYANELIEELELALTPHGYHLNLELLYHVQDEDSVYRTFSPGHCDGVIKFDTIRPAREHDWLVAIRRRGLPVVCVDMEQRPGLDSVHTDVVEQARMATAHLLERGHPRVAVVVDELDDISRQMRLAGHRRALAQAGIEYDDAGVIPWRSDASPGGLWTRLATLSPRPTGIWCYNSELAVALFMEILKQGVRVPEELALLSLADAPLHQQLQIPLTSVNTNQPRVARTAVERLLAQIRDPAAPPQQILVEPFLVKRASA